MKIDSFDLHDDAKSDLLSLRETDPKKAAILLVIFEQIKTDPNFIDKLTQHGNNHFEDFKLSVKVWEAAKNKRTYGDFVRLIPRLPATGLFTGTNTTHGKS